MVLQYQPTPVVEIADPVAEEYGVRLLLRREDQNHPFVSGNKWWKLKYNLAAAREEGYKRVLTFGGAYSNHLFATAAAAQEAGLLALGVVRGEENLPLNPTLQFVQSKGMELRYASREEYRRIRASGFVRGAIPGTSDCFIIPEGGTNLHAVRGCAELGESLVETPFDHLFLPVGTGGTIAGIIAGLGGRRNIIGIPVLKNGNFLNGEIEMLLKNFNRSSFTNWRLLTDYHHGGYAKTSTKLISFIQNFSSMHQIPLDHVYTGKMCFAVLEEIRKNSFPRGTTIMMLHTGGLQGSLSSLPH